MTGTDSETAALGIPPGMAIVLTGSLFPRAEERELEQRDLATVQVIDAAGRRRVGFFDGWGERGVNAIALLPGAVLVSTGADLVRVDLPSGEVSTCEVGGLEDVHELTVDGDDVWIPNTASDEIVAYDHTTDRVRERISLAAMRTPTRAGSASRETFHVNNVFRDGRGTLHVLVHHVSGRQLQMAQRLIKRQGDGGLLDLSGQRRIDLQLRGPHSVRRWRDRYLICDSGNASVNEYDAGWRLVRRIPVAGWGRGFAVHGSAGWVGISAIRRRYRDVLGHPPVANQVQAIDLERGAARAAVVLPDVEQVNSVDLVTEEYAELLLSLPD